MLGDRVKLQPARLVRQRHMEECNLLFKARIELNGATHPFVIVFQRLKGVDLPAQGGRVQTVHANIGPHIHEKGFRRRFRQCVHGLLQDPAFPATRRPHALGQKIVSGMHVHFKGRGDPWIVHVHREARVVADKGRWLGTTAVQHMLV